MKFVCNNCGFSAEVPDRRSNCPMCASSNVSVVALTENSAISEKSKKEQEKIDPPVLEDTVQPVVSQKTETVASTESPRKEKITLTDNFFDSKPNKEEQEIANILKELYPESAEKKSKIKIPGIKMIAGGLAVVVALSAVAFFAFSSGKKDTVTEEQKKPEEVIKETPPETVKEIPEEVVKEVVPEKQVPIEEKKVEIEEEKVVEKPVEKPIEQPVKKEEIVKPVEQKKTEKIQVVQVKKVAPVQKKVTVKPPVAKENNDDSFNTFVQAGHKSLSEKRYTDALHEYKNASRLNPTNGSIYKFLGIAYAYLQNQEQACVNYKKYIQLSPNAPDKAQVEAFIKACP